MKIAIVGAGIAGLTTARLLNREHQVTVFEAEDRIGGHTNTCLLYTSPSPRDATLSRMPSSA